MRQDNREKLRRDTRMRTDAARGVYARRGNLPVLGGKIWLILYCLRRSFVQMTVCRYGAYCRRWKIVRSSIKSGGLPGYVQRTGASGTAPPRRKICERPAYILYPKMGTVQVITGTGIVRRSGESQKYFYERNMPRELVLLTMFRQS